MKKVLLILSVVLLFACEKEERIDNINGENKKDDFKITSFEIQNEPIVIGQLINARTEIDRIEKYEYEVSYSLIDKEQKEVLKASGFEADIPTSKIKPGKYILRLSVYRMKTGDKKTLEKNIDIITPFFFNAAIGNTKEKIIETVYHLYAKEPQDRAIKIFCPIQGKKGVELLFYDYISFGKLVVYIFRDGKFIGGEIRSVSLNTFATYRSLVAEYSSKLNDNGISDEKLHLFTKEKMDELKKNNESSTINQLIKNGQYSASHKWDTKDFAGYVSTDLSGEVIFYVYKK